MKTYLSLMVSKETNDTTEVITICPCHGLKHILYYMFSFSPNSSLVPVISSVVNLSMSK